MAPACDCSSAGGNGIDLGQDPLGCQTERDAHMYGPKPLLLLVGLVVVFLRLLPFC